MMLAVLQELPKEERPGSCPPCLLSHPPEQLRQHRNARIERVGLQHPGDKADPHILPLRDEERVALDQCRERIPRVRVVLGKERLPRVEELGELPALTHEPRDVVTGRHADRDAHAGEDSVTHSRSHGLYSCSTWFPWPSM